MKLGIHKINNADYHAGEGLSSSGLKELLKSAAHYRVWAGGKESKSKDKGSLVHTLILEPDLFSSEYAIGDFKIRRGKDYDEALENAAGKTLISPAEYEEAQRIVASFNAQRLENPELNRLMTGLAETAFYWEDPETGIQCKCKPDVLNEHGITDLKTSKGAGFDAFQRALIDYLYFVSAAFYLRGVNHVLETMPNRGLISPKTFNIVVIETEAPYPVAIYKLEPATIDFGNQLVNAALDAYSRAVSTDTWEGYPKEAIPMGLPPYALYKFNKR